MGNGERYMCSQCDERDRHENELAEANDMTTADLERALMGYPGVRKVIAPSKVYREVMLARDGQMLLIGRLWDIKSKSVGAGLRRVWLEVADAP